MIHTIKEEHYLLYRLMLRTIRYALMKREPELAKIFPVEVPHADKTFIIDFQDDSKLDSSRSTMKELIASTADQSAACLINWLMWRIMCPRMYSWRPRILRRGFILA